MPRPNKERAEAQQFCPRTWSLIPMYTGIHTHVHGYGCPKSGVTMPKALGKDALHSWARMPKGLGNCGQNYLCFLRLYFADFNGIVNIVEKGEKTWYIQIFFVP